MSVPSETSNHRQEEANNKDRSNDGQNNRTLNSTPLDILGEGDEDTSESKTLHHDGDDIISNEDIIMDIDDLKPFSDEGEGGFETKIVMGEENDDTHDVDLLELDGGTDDIDDDHKGDMFGSSGLLTQCDLSSDEDDDDAFSTTSSTHDIDHEQIANSEIKEKNNNKESHEISSLNNLPISPPPSLVNQNGNSDSNEIRTQEEEPVVERPLTGETVTEIKDDNQPRTQEDWEDVKQINKTENGHSCPSNTNNDAIDPLINESPTVGLSGIKTQEGIMSLDEMKEKTKHSEEEQIPGSGTATIAMKDDMKKNISGVEVGNKSNPGGGETVACDTANTTTDGKEKVHKEHRSNGTRAEQESRNYSSSSVIDQMMMSIGKIDGLSEPSTCNESNNQKDDTMVESGVYEAFVNLNEQTGDKHMLTETKLNLDDDTLRKTSEVNSTNKNDGNEKKDSNMCNNSTEIDELKHQQLQDKSIEDKARKAEFENATTDQSTLTTRKGNDVKKIQPCNDAPGITLENQESQSLSVYNGATQTLPSQFPLSMTEKETNTAILPNNSQLGNNNRETSLLSHTPQTEILSYPRDFLEVGENINIQNNGSLPCAKETSAENRHEADITTAAKGHKIIDSKTEMREETVLRTEVRDEVGENFDHCEKIQAETNTEVTTMEQQVTKSGGKNKENITVEGNSNRSDAKESIEDENVEINMMEHNEKQGKSKEKGKLSKNSGKMASTGKSEKAKVTGAGILKKSFGGSSGWLNSRRKPNSKGLKIVKNDDVEDEIEGVDGSLLQLCPPRLSGLELTETSAVLLSPKTEPDSDDDDFFDEIPGKKSCNEAIIDLENSFSYEASYDNERNGYASEESCESDEENEFSDGTTSDKDEKKKYVNHSSIDETDEIVASLIDTQSQELSTEKSLNRITRGHKKWKRRSTSNTFSDGDDDDDHNDDDDDDNVELSQSTSNIRSKLRVLADINVSKVTEKLRFPQVPEMTTMRKKIDKLSKRNSLLETQKKKIQKENHTLQKLLSEALKKVEEKRQLCDEMERQIERVEPILKAAVNLDIHLEANLSPNVLQDKKSQRKKQKRVILDSDCEDEDSKSSQNCTDLRTPKKHQTRTLTAPLVSMSDRKRKKKKKKEESIEKVTFPELWKFLQSRGWTFRTGPEPYGKVYVPPNGHVRRGAVLGKHFYFANNLWEQASKLGFVDMDVDEGQNDGIKDGSEASTKNSLPSKKTQRNSVANDAKVGDRNTDVISPIEKKTQNVIPCDDSSTDSDKEHDNTSLVGRRKALTNMSMAKCSKLILDFLTLGDRVLFMRDLFGPLWKCIKDEQASEVQGLGWNYVKSRGAGNLARTYFFAPPQTAGVKGTFGKDYFPSEEAVVAYLLKDMKEFDQEITGFKDRNMKSLETFEIKLSRAIEEHVSYDEITDTSVSRAKRRSRKRKLDEGEGIHEIKETQLSKRSKKSDDEIGAPKNTLISYSQNAMEGAEILLELTKGQDASESGIHPNSAKIATKKGVTKLLQFRSRKTPCNNCYDNCNKKELLTRSKLRTPTKNSDGVHHLTQSPGGMKQGHPLSASKRKIVWSDGEKLPLHGLSFFGSGIDDRDIKRVLDLGGKLLRDVKGKSLLPENTHRKLFFVSDPKFRRTHKYLLAGALGVPMLHFSWLVDMEKSFKVFQADKMGEGKAPDPFDSKRYTSHRLPTGLSNETGLFVMQRARHAKNWARPECEDGSLVLDGLNIAIALESSEVEKKWIDIIRTVGANFVNLANGDSSTIPDTILVDSVCLPPHNTAIPTKVAKQLGIVNRLNQKGHNIFIVDLSWVTQSIVQRVRVSIDTNPQYQPMLKKKVSAGLIPLYSIKVKRDTGLARYEVGDSIFFGKKHGKRSTGRIVKMYHDGRAKKNIVDVKVLDVNNRFELMEGGKNAPLIQIDDSDLCGHIILLGGKDFQYVYDGWSRDSEIVFMQKKA